MNRVTELTTVGNIWHLVLFHDFSCLVLTFGVVYRGGPYFSRPTFGFWLNVSEYSRSAWIVVGIRYAKEREPDPEWHSVSYDDTECRPRRSVQEKTPKTHRSRRLLVISVPERRGPWEVWIVKNRDGRILKEGEKLRLTPIVHQGNNEQSDLFSLLICHFWEMN